ncbi:MAG: hypothetical protein QNJ34_23900 [Xenococcaceae cyanobacterium MO_188.B29]|nr:hypothetical protein [Xenococcaceae cyanobacterium MO_188.B29]
MGKFHSERSRFVIFPRLLFYCSTRAIGFYRSNYVMLKEKQMGNC